MTVATPEGYNTVFSSMNSKGANHMSSQVAMGAQNKQLWRSAWPMSTDLWSKINSGPKKLITNNNKFQKSNS